MKVRSMRGVEIDMTAFLAQNESIVAVGNAGLNARGDAIGRGGKVIKTRDQMAQEYHRSNPKAVRTVALRDLNSEVMTTPAAATTPALGSEKFDVDYVDPATAVEAITSKNARPKRKIEDTDQ